jgi:hypothetical protein
MGKCTLTLSWANGAALCVHRISLRTSTATHILVTGKLDDGKDVPLVPRSEIIEMLLHKRDFALLQQDDVILSTSATSGGGGSGPAMETRPDVTAMQAPPRTFDVVAATAAVKSVTVVLLCLWDPAHRMGLDSLQLFGARSASVEITSMVGEELPRHSRVAPPSAARIADTCRPSAGGLTEPVVAGDAPSLCAVRAGDHLKRVRNVPSSAELVAELKVCKAIWLPCPPSWCVLGNGWRESGSD